jgi:hypothetical protein
MGKLTGKVAIVTGSKPRDCQRRLLAAAGIFRGSQLFIQ